MSRFLLDTSVLIDLSYRLEPTRGRIVQLTADRNELGVCAVVVTEFTAGLKPDQVPGWERFFRTLEYWETSARAAAEAGRYRYDLARRGLTISTVDALIAATARERFAAIITENPQVFPMTEVQVISHRR